MLAPLRGALFIHLHFFLSQLHYTVGFIDTEQVLHLPGPANTVGERPLRKISSRPVRSPPQDDFSIAIINL